MSETPYDAEMDRLLLALHSNLAKVRSMLYWMKVWTDE